MPIEELTDINQEIFPPDLGESQEARKHKKRHFLVVIAGTLTGLALIIFLLSLLLMGRKSAQEKKLSPLPPALSSPSPIPLEIPLGEPSYYATDSAVLKIEENIRSIDQDLQLTDLRESGLTPPSLDWEVGFEQ